MVESQILQIAYLVAFTVIVVSVEQVSDGVVDVDILYSLLTH